LRSCFRNRSIFLLQLSQQRLSGILCSLVGLGVGKS
jgi:hypothetical protein